MQTTSEVEVADVLLTVPVDEHTDTVVHIVGLDTALPKYPDAQALQVKPVEPVLQLHTAFDVGVAAVVVKVPDTTHTVTAVHVVGLEARSP